jgi:two-component system, OmpR family, response regulator MtrA
MSAPAVAELITNSTHTPVTHRRPRLRAVPDTSHPAPSTVAPAALPAAPAVPLASPLAAPLAAPLTVTISIDGGEVESRDRLLAALRELVSLAGPGADVALRAPAEAPAGEPGVISLDPAPRAAFRDGQLLDLSRLEYDLLLFFAEHPRQVFTRAQLLSRVWGHVHTGVRTVDVHISRLRTKLDDPELITTVYGVGYRLADSAPVRLV